MATTYTTNYNLGKQENHADKFDMDVITDNADKIDAALTGLQSGIDGKQDTIDASHKLSSDLVDDTNKTHKFATQAQLDQIQTNKTNILLSSEDILKLQEWDGLKNKATITSGTFTAPAGTRYTTIPLSEPMTGEIVVYFGSLTSDDTTGTTCACILSSETTSLQQLSMARGSGVYQVYNISDTATYLALYPAANYQTSQGKTVTWENLMICSKAAWDISHKYVPPAMSNVELTAGISNWESYDCLDTTRPNDIDINNSQLTVYHNAFLKRVVISCKIKFLLQRTSASTALLIGNMVNIPNYTQLIPLNSVREFVSTSEYDAFIAKNATNYAIAFAVNSGTLAANTEIRAQFEYTYF